MTENKLNIIHCIDLTHLDEAATENQWIDLAQRAEQHQVAAVCVYSKAVPTVQAHYSGPIATVANFPLGKDSQKAVMHDLERYFLNDRISEIDYVFSYPAYLSSQEKQALTEVSQVIRFAHEAQRTIKIIIETGAFEQSLNHAACKVIERLSRQLMDLECDFIKTSTGKNYPGANAVVAAAISKAIKESGTPCGIKLSGGISKPEQAIQLINAVQQWINKPIDPSWFRIGASRLLDEMESF